MDKYTFGKTPAAIFLTDRLVALGSDKITRKVSKYLHDVRQKLNELVRANDAHHLSAHTVGFICGALREHVLSGEYHVDYLDELIGDRDPDEVMIELQKIFDLTTNIMIGEIKSVQRKVTGCRHIEHSIARMKNFPAANHPVISGEIDDITPELLQQRSKIKLARLGKTDTLY